MKVSVKGDKNKGKNPRRVIARKLFVADTEEAIAAAFVKWFGENGYTEMHIGQGGDIKDDRGCPVGWIYSSGGIGRISDIGVSCVSVNGMERNE